MNLMRQIQIKNIGPLEDTGVIFIKPVMLIIGKQSMGKSTFMKVLCFCEWLEKTIMTGDQEVLNKYTHNGSFVKNLSKFFRLGDSFFSDKSEIHYRGDCISIDLEQKARNAKITKLAGFDEKRFNEKLCFLPAERNLVYASRNIRKDFSTDRYDMLFNYISEYSEEENEHFFTKNNPLVMPFDDETRYYYDDASRMPVVEVGHKAVPIQPMYTSSGIQSSLPMLLMILGTLRKAGTKKKVSLEEITNKITRIVMDASSGSTSEIHLNDQPLQLVTNFITYRRSRVFIEEPEENLFPESQYEMVLAIIKALKETIERTGEDSYVMMTTHSPYILSTVNLLLKSVIAQGVQTGKKGLLTEEYLLPVNKFGAYCADHGTMTDILDKESGFIDGEYLDSISQEINRKAARINEVIYGDIQ
jgi:AAA15 family ATPase/GTPase